VTSLRSLDHPNAGNQARCLDAERLAMGPSTMSYRRIGGVAFPTRRRCRVLRPYASLSGTTLVPNVAVVVRRARLLVTNTPV
jgi:hypothetical protein